MTAGANKFLRIYYGTVREYLKGKGLWSEEEPELKPKLEPKSKEVNPD